MRAIWLPAILFAAGFNSAHAVSFISADTDQDGYISQEEAKTIDGLSADIFAQLDVNEDNKLSFSEFDAYVKKEDK